MEVTLGDYLRQRRLDRTLSIRELAKLIDKSPAMISEIESGNRLPSDEMMQALARVLRTTIDELRKYDSRPQKKEIGDLLAKNPNLGLAFRTLVDKYKAGMPPEQLQQWIAKAPVEPKEEKEE